MPSPYDQFDEDIKRLKRDGCSNSDILAQLQHSYSELAKQDNKLFKMLQNVKRKLRESE